MEHANYYFTVVEAVVKSNSQSNGKGEISTPCGSKAPEWISMKRSTHNAFLKCPPIYLWNNSVKINWFNDFWYIKLEQFFGFLKVKWLHVTGELDKSVRCSCQICQMAIEQFSLYQLAPEINNSKDSLGENCYWQSWWQAEMELTMLIFWLVLWRC